MPPEVGEIAVYNIEMASGSEPVRTPGKPPRVCGEDTPNKGSITSASFDLLKEFYCFDQSEMILQGDWYGYNGT